MLRYPFQHPYSRILEPLNRLPRGIWCPDMSLVTNRPLSPQVARALGLRDIGRLRAILERKS
jgi:hypothetical protein